MSTYKLGNIYNCHASTISKVLHKYNILVTKLINLPMDEICKKYQDGMSTYELAKECNCSQDVISKRLNKHGINVTKLITIPIDEICKKYINGMSLRSIATEYNCDRSVIKNRLEKCNIDIDSERINSKILILSDEIICNDYRKGTTIEELAQVCECSRGAITRRLIKYGIDIKSSSDYSRTELPENEICELYQSGISTYELAKQYNCFPDTIKDRLIKNNIEIRSIKEASTFDSKKRRSAAMQGISYDEWTGFSEKQKYCTLFNLSLKEAIRLYFNNKCFIDNECEENGRALNVHHVNFDKRCGCNATQLCIFVPVKAKWNGIFNGNKEKNRWYWYSFLMNKIFIEHPNYFTYHIPIWGMNELEYNYDYVFEKFRRR